MSRVADYVPDAAFLDLFSTSPTTEDFVLVFPPVFCSYHAPCFAYQIEGKHYAIAQGCCNHWDCKRCGIMRAKQEYGRVVEGLRSLAREHPIYFITITCQGRRLSHEQAEAGYLKWTNRFLDASRARAKRSGQKWCYVQVTERQKRGHPHSHILTTFDPQDLHTSTVVKWEIDNRGERKKREIPALRSDWIQGQVLKSGLGEQYDVSIVATIEGASRYVAKYLFKQTALEAGWPKGWKRIRYSQSFPKLPDRQTDALPLIRAEDWKSLARKAVVVTTHEQSVFHEAKYQLNGHDTIVRLKEK